VVGLRALVNAFAASERLRGAIREVNGGDEYARSKFLGNEEHRLYLTDDEYNDIGPRIQWLAQAGRRRTSAGPGVGGPSRCRRRASWPGRSSHRGGRRGLVE